MDKKLFKRLMYTEFEAAHMQTNSDNMLMNVLTANFNDHINDNKIPRETIK